jgi:hypothetical protein
MIRTPGVSQPYGLAFSLDAGGASAPSYFTDGTHLSLVFKGQIPAGTAFNNRMIATVGDHDIIFIAGRIDMINPGGTVVRIGDASDVFADTSVANTTDIDEKFVLCVDLDMSGGVGTGELRMRWFSTTSVAGDAVNPVEHSNPAGVTDSFGFASALELCIGAGTDPQNNLRTVPDTIFSGLVVYRGELSDSELKEIFDYDHPDWWIRGTDALGASTAQNIMGVVGFATAPGYAQDVVAASDGVLGFVDSITDPDRITSPSLLDQLTMISISGSPNGGSDYVDPTDPTLPFPETVFDLTTRLSEPEASEYFQSFAGANNLLFNWLSPQGSGVTGDDKVIVIANSRGSRSIGDESASGVSFQLMQNYAHGIIAHELSEGNPVGGIGHTDFTRFGSTDSDGPNYIFSGEAITAATADSGGAALAKYGTGGQSRNHQPIVLSGNDIWGMYSQKSDIGTRMVQRMAVLCLPGLNSSVTIQARSADDAAGTGEQDATMLSHVTVDYVMQANGAEPDTSPILDEIDGNSVVIDTDTTVATLAGPSSNDDAAKTMVIATGLSGTNQPKAGQVIRLVGGSSDGYTNEVVSYDSVTGVLTLRHFWESNGEVTESGTPRNVSDATSILLGWYGFAVIEGEFDISGADTHYGFKTTNGATDIAAISYLECRNPDRAGPTIIPGGMGGAGYERQIAWSHSEMWGVYFKAIGVGSVDICSATQGETTPAQNIREIRSKVLDYLPRCGFSLGHEPLSNSGNGANAGGTSNNFLRNGDMIQPNVTDELDATTNQWRVHSGLAAELGIPFATPEVALGSFQTQISMGTRAGSSGGGTHLSVLGNEKCWEYRRSQFETLVTPQSEGHGMSFQFLDPLQQLSLLSIIIGEDEADTLTGRL